VKQNSRFIKYAWFVVAYTILVILWGAVVRATGSGAGCGNHWPACNGEVIPRPEQIETLIEFSHRVTSAISGLFVLILLFWAYRLRPVHPFVRRMAVLSFIFILIEGALGAALVRFELVADNASTARAFMVGLHLMNTLVLLAFMTLTAWGAAKSPDMRVHAPTWLKWAAAIALLTFGFMSSIGAVTALGDTLFPAESLAQGLQEKFDPEAHFLVRLRFYHPALAIIVSMYLYGLGYYLMRKYDSPHLHRYVNGVFIMVAIQVGAGFLNVILLVPIWMQIVHLLLADTLWVLLVVTLWEAFYNTAPVEQQNEQLVQPSPAA